MAGAEPLICGPMTVEDAWIDYNGHLNMAYYNVLFDRAADALFDLLCIGADYAKTEASTIFTAEMHVRYLRELHAGDTVTSTLQIIDHDAKRLHGYQEIRHSDGWVAASAEALWLHVDMSGPKVAPFPDAVAEHIARLQSDHDRVGRPDNVGTPIGIRRKGR